MRRNGVLLALICCLLLAGCSRRPQTPEEQARRQLLSVMRPADISDSAEAREAIAAALRPEYISIGADRIEVWFPRGALPDGEFDGWVLRYVDDPALLDILQPWAIPDSSGNAG